MDEFCTFFAFSSANLKSGRSPCAPSLQLFSNFGVKMFFMSRRSTTQKLLDAGVQQGLVGRRVLEEFGDGEWKLLNVPPRNGGEDPESPGWDGARSRRHRRRKRRSRRLQQHCCKTSVLPMHLQRIRPECAVYTIFIKLRDALVYYVEFK